MNEFSTLTKLCEKSHLSVVTDNFPSTLKSFGFDAKETFLKRTLKRLLQIYTIKSNILGTPTKRYHPETSGVLANICEEAQSAAVQTSFKVMCTQTLLPLLVEVQKNPSESVHVGD